MFAGVIHVPEFGATLGADDEVFVEELNERAAIVAGHAVFDDVDAHDSSVAEGCSAVGGAWDTDSL